MESSDVSPTPSRSRRPFARRGPLWFLLLLLLGLLASWILGRRPHDDGGGPGPRELPLRTVAFTSGETLRSIPLDPPRGPAPSGTTLGRERLADEMTALSRGSPFFGPLSASGRVVDAEGGAVAGLDVRLLRAFDASTAPGRPRPAEIEAAVTDATGRYAFQCEAAAGPYQVFVHDRRGTVHVTGSRDLRPWTHVEFDDLGLAPPRRIEVRVDLAGGPAPSFGARLQIGPRPPPGATGSAPLRLEPDLLPPRAAPPRRDHAVPADGRVLVTGLGAGDWEIVVAAREHAPRRLDLGAEDALQVRLLLADLVDVTIAGTGGEPLWTAADDAGGGRWLLAADRSGTLTLPRAWWEAPGTRLWRPGSPPIATTELAGPPGGNRSLPPMGRIRAEGELAPGRRVDLRLLADSADDPRPEATAEVDRWLGYRDLPAESLDRLLCPGRWRVHWRDGADREGDPIEVEIEAGRIAPLALPVASSLGRGLSLRLVDAEDGVPLPAARVALDDGSEALLDALATERVLARADAEGRVALEGLAPGRLALVLGATGRLPQRLVVEVPPARDARIERVVELERAHAGLELRVQDDEGRSLPPIDALVVDRLGDVARARSDDRGRLVFADLGVGPHVLFFDRGLDGLPLDDWTWLARESGAPVFELEAGRRREASWILPRPRRYRLRFRFATRATTPPPTVVDLVLGAHERGLGPGLRPAYDLGAREAGVYEVGPLFPGRYRVVGREDTRLAVAEIDLPSRGEATVSIDLIFDSP